MAQQKKNTKTGYSPWDFLTFYVSIILFAIFKWGCLSGFFGDGLNFYTLDAREYFSLLLTTAGALLGILVAALLLSFQVIGREAKRRKGSNVLHNPWVISFVGLSVAFMATLVISYITISSFDTDNNLTIGYYLLYLFFIFLFLLFYVVYILLRNTDTLEKTKNIISSLTIKDFTEVKQSYYGGSWMSEHNLQLSEVRDEILYAIRDNDNGALYTLLSELIRHANQLITIETPRNDVEAIVDALSIVCKDANATADSNQRSTYYEMISQCVQAMYNHAAIKQIPLLYYHDLRTYYSDLAEHLMKKGDLTRLQKVIDVLNISLNSHLKNNCPPENQLKDLLDLYKQSGGVHNVASEIQWENIGDFIYDIGRIQQLAIEYKSKDIYIAARRSLHIVAEYIQHGDYPSLGKYQRSYLMLQIINLRLLFNAEKALEAALFKDTLETYHLDGSLIADIIINDPTAVKKILTGIGDHLINACRRSQLNVWFTINQFGVIPRHTASNYLSNEIVRRSTQYIFNVFKTMKKEVEVEAKVSPEQFKVYEEIRRQLKALSASLKKEEKENNNIPLIAEIENYLDSFQTINVISDYNIVPWPDDKQSRGTPVSCIRILSRKLRAFLRQRF